MPEFRADVQGDAVAAVRAGAALIVSGPAAPSIATELWPTLSPDASTEVIERLTADGLGRTPDFALATWSGEAGALGTVRIIVRGAFEVVAGDAVVSGAAVSTWAERVVEGVERIMVTAAGIGADASWLPILDGVVPTAAIAVPHADGSDASPVRSAASSAAPSQPAGRVVAEASASKGPQTAPTVLAPVPPASVPETPAPEAPVVAPAPEAPVPAPTAPEHTIAPVEETIVGVSELIQPPAATAAGGAAEPETDLDETIARPAGEFVSPPIGDGDHDGLTIASSDIQRLRAERDASRPSAPEAASPAAGPEVRLRMPDGSFEPLVHEIVLGRAPSVSKVSGGRLPRIVTIGQGDADISRSHVRLALEGGTVVVTDLHSRNGTLVVAPGKPPVKLRAGEPTPVLIGTVVDLGGGWTIQVVGD
ncbi:FHA domain-containing protein [Agromyces endophyticus]|uniref:FHA domain-containing protein n=1 Tax=Agromyces sp. H17E-10 TaxID=2932244 RepID=UPI001FD24B27|nr:FHA domain-containing protein [Agromyces sp. H17E-10]UOQ88811.1 FHA domain-containing protein [Agromyces sp. H17E-10]